MLRYLFIDLLGGVLRWPVWWYTQGVKAVFQWAGRMIRDYARSLAINVWIRNIFVPMYGTRDWQSRIISFFMRVVQIIGRSIALAAWIFGVFVLIVAYIVLPIASILGLLYHSSAFFL